MADQLSKTAPGAPPLDWPTRFLMLVGGLMVTLALTVVAPVLPQIESALARTADEKLLVKMLVPFAGAAMVVGAPLTGVLIDRIGLRPVLIVHSLIFAIAGTAGLYIDNVYALLGARLLTGLPAAGLATISMTLINTRLDGAARAKWMGFHISAAMLGSLLIFPTIGALGELGWRWPFAVYGVGLPIALVAAFGLRSSKPSTVEDRGEGLRNPLKWFPLWFLPLALVIGSVTYLPTVYLSFVARDVGLTSPATLSTIMLADAIIGATMALLFGWSQRRLSSHQAFIFSFSCTGTGMLVVSLATSLGGIVAGMLIFGFGIGWFMPNLMISLSRRVTQHQQGQAVGILKGAHYLASPLAVLAVEPIARAFGSAGALMASSIVAFSAVAVFVVLSARRGRAAAPAEAV